MSEHSLKGFIVGRDVRGVVRQAIEAQRQGNSARAAELLQGEREHSARVARDYARSVTRIDTPDE
jgi:hypothetical protein